MKPQGWRPLHGARGPLSSPRLSQQGRGVLPCLPNPGSCFWVIEICGYPSLHRSNRNIQDLNCCPNKSSEEWLRGRKRRGGRQGDAVSTVLEHVCMYSRDRSRRAGVLVSSWWWSVVGAAPVSAPYCCPSPSSRLAGRASVEASPIWHGHNSTGKRSRERCNNWRAIGCNAEARSCVTMDPDAWISQAVA